jgi:hypothetical protein
MRANVRFLVGARQQFRARPAGSATSPSGIAVSDVADFSSSSQTLRVSSSDTLGLS